MVMLRDLKEQHEGDKGKNDEEKETLYSITKLLLEQAQKQQQERSYWVFFCWFLPENFLVWNWFRQIVKKKWPIKGTSADLSRSYLLMAVKLGQEVPIS